MGRLLLTTVSFFPCILLRWVSACSREFAEFLSDRVLDDVSLSKLLPDHLELDQIFIVLALKPPILCFHLLCSLFEHVLPLLALLNFSRLFVKFLSVLLFNLV